MVAAKKNKKTGKDKMNILLIQFDFMTWARARGWSYTGNFAYEEAFAANNADCFIIPAMHEIPYKSPGAWLHYIKDLCKDKHFDQVWVWLVHGQYDSEFLEWIQSVAPVRVGWLGESLSYKPEEYAEAPHLKNRQAVVSNMLSYMTHVLAVDEMDVDYINSTNPGKAIWLPMSIPSENIADSPASMTNKMAAFYGSIYGERSLWLSRPDLSGLIARPPAPEDAFGYPQMFDDLNMNCANNLQNGIATDEKSFKEYIDKLKAIRKGIFNAWMEGLKDWRAVVNLPSFGKVYTSRVQESMAAGVPAISWEVPDRPRNKSLFIPGEEILLYKKDNPVQLADCIRRVVDDYDNAYYIAENALTKIKKYHTMDMRIKQVLDWLKDGTMPDYGESMETEIVNIHSTTDYIRVSDELAAEGRIDDAYAVLNDALGKFDDKTDILKAIAVRHFECGKLDEAEKIFRQILETHPNDMDAILSLWRLVDDAGDLVESATLIQRALAVDASDAEVWVSAALFAQKWGDAETYFVACQTLKNIAPNHPMLESLLKVIDEAVATYGDEPQPAEEKTETDSFYENLWENDSYFSSANPNYDEMARWTVMSNFLDSVFADDSPQDRKTRRILDVGCGRGWLTNLLSKYGIAEGIEPVDGVVVSNRERYPHLRFYSGTADVLLNSPGFEPYDVVISSEVIEHVPQAGQQAFANDIAKLVKPGGMVMITTPRGEVYDQWMQITKFTQPVEDWLTEDQTKQAFEEGGLQTIGSERIYVELPNYSYLLYPTEEELAAGDLIPLYQVWAFAKPQESVQTYTDDEVLYDYEGRTDSQPGMVHFLLIDKCNAKCVMCGGDYFHNDGKRRITLDKFKIMAKNLHLERFNAICLAGAGDPLLNPDLIPIIEFVNNTYPHIRISITTNGIALTKKLSEKLMKCRVNDVNISINSATRETFKRIMQVDAFDCVIKNAKDFVEIRETSKVKPILQFSSAINAININELPKMVELAHEIGLDSCNIMYCRFYPQKMRDLNIESPEYILEDKESLFYHQELSDKMVTKAEKLAAKYGIRFMHEPLFKDNSPASNCVWTEHVFMVGFDGEIYPCGGSEVHFKEKVESGAYDFGNALTQPLEEFWNGDFYRALRLSSKQGSKCLIDECKTCANLMRTGDVRSHIMDWDEPALTEPNNEQANTPMFSVIIPTYNRLDMLPRAIESVLKQTYTDFEIIVVNDAGEDVGDIVNSYNDQRIKYFSHQANSGLGAARNTGIKNASGKYIALLDDDDEFYPNHLETAAKHINDKSPIIYTDAVRATYNKSGSSYVQVDKSIPYSLDYDRNKLFVGNIAPCNCFVFSRDLALKAGLFDEKLNTLEDWEFWIRLSGLSRFVHVAEATVQVNWRTDGTTMTTSRQADFARNRETIYTRYREDIQKIPNLENVIDEFKTIWQQDNQPFAGFASIIVLTYNALSYTKKCVASLLENTEFPHEVIFVDNASTDGTVDYLKSIEKEHANFKVILNDKNLGYPGGNNVGISQAIGNYIVLLNSDVVLTPGWLESLIDAAKTDPRIGIAGPMTNFVQGTQLVKDVSYDVKTLSGLNLFAEKWKNKNFGKLDYQWGVVGFCMLIKREVINAIGGLDTNYGLGNFEDNDYCIRASIAGFKCAVVKECFVHHFGSASFTGNDDVDYSLQLMKNWEVFKKRWGISEKTAYGTSIDMSKILAQPFVKAKHYHDLGQLSAGMDSNELAACEAKSNKELGVFAYQSGKFQDAVDYLKEALISSPEDIEILNSLAVSYASLKNYKDAHQAISHALEIAPDYVMGNINMAKILCESGKAVDAYIYASKAAELEPRNKDAYETLKIVRAKIRNIRQAKSSKSAKKQTNLQQIDQALTKINKLISDLEEHHSSQSAKEDRITLSLCMIVKDEEDFMEECLKSIEDVVDEIIVVDTGSTDSTVQIARAHGAKVFSFNWNENYSDARNEALSHATGKWVLHMDADEVLDAASKQVLLDTIRNASNEAYEVKFYNYLTDSPSPDTSHTVARLHKNKPEYRFVGRVHENIMPSIMAKDGKLAMSDVLFHHYGYKPEIIAQKNKHARYTKSLHDELAENPNDLRTLHHLAAAYYSNDEYEKALPYLVKASELVDPSQSIASQVYSRLANALIMLGRPAEAIEALDRTVSMGLVHPELAFCRGNALNALEKHKESIKAYELAKKLGKSSDWTGDRGTAGYKADFGIARAYAALGDIKNAEKYCKKVLEVEPDHAQANEIIAQVYDQSKRYSDSIIHWQKVRAYNPRHSEPYTRLSQAYIELGMLEDALRELGNLVSAGYDDAKVRFKMAECLDALGRKDKAESEYLNAINMKPDFAEAYNNLGILYASSDKLSESISCYGKAVEIKPDYVSAYFNAGDVLYKAGLYEQAAGTYQSGLMYMPEHAPAYFQLGNCCYMMKAYDAAITSYKEALRINPDYEEAKSNLALTEAELVKV